MLGERDLIGVVGVRLVAVNSLCAIRILGRRHDLALCWCWRCGGFGTCGGTEAWRGGRVPLGGAQAVHAADRRRVLEPVELGRGVHLRGLDGCRRRLGRVEAIPGVHGVARITALLGQGEGIYEGARNSRRRGAKVEDPDNLGHNCQHHARRENALLQTYRHHGEEYEPCSRGFLGAVRRVDKEIDRGRRQHQPASEIGRDGNMICLDGVGRNDNEDTGDDEEIVDHGPPGIRRKVRLGLHLGEDASEERDDPRKLP